MPNCCAWSARCYVSFKLGGSFGLARGRTTGHRLYLPLGPLLALILCFQSCTDSSSPTVAIHALETQYLKRLGNVLELALSVGRAQNTALVPFPRRRALKLPVTPLSIDVAQFAQLHGCDLGDLAASRSSSLGRVAGPVELLAQDQRWVQQAPSCAATGVPWLSDVVAAKRANLPLRFWNAVVAGAELSHAMSLAGSTAADTVLPVYPDQALRGLADNWVQLSQASLATSVLNSNLQQLANSYPFGAQRLRWLQQRNTLAQAAHGLTQGAAKICRNNQPTPKAKILRRVFNRFYREGIQPELARRYSAEQQSLAALARLLNELRGALELSDVDKQPVVEFTRWYRLTLDTGSAESEWRQTQLAVREHAAAWQSLWQQCGMPLAPNPAGRVGV